MSYRKHCYAVNPVDGNPIAEVNVSHLRHNQDVSLLDGQSGDLRRFTIVRGGSQLWDVWFSNTTLVLRTPTGDEATVKVAAFPTSNGSYGYFEFT